MKQRPLNTDAPWRGLAVTVLIICMGIAGNWLAWRYVMKSRIQAAALQQAVLQEPTRQLAQVSDKMELDSHRPKLIRLAGIVVSRDMVGSFVDLLEVEAVHAGVSIVVSSIQEEVILDANKKPVASPGPLRDVRLKIMATGDPTNLLAFLHVIEHLPRLNWVPAWELKTSELSPGLAARYPLTPLSAPVLPGGPLSSPALAPATLRADIIVALQDKATSYEN